MSSLPPDPAAAAPDAAVARAEERLAFLRELTEIGMELARGLREQAAAGPVDPKAGRSPAETFDRLSRAIRLTIALEAKTDEALADLKAGVVREREETSARRAETAKETARMEGFRRMAKVFDRTYAVAEVEAEDSEAFDSLYEALTERLEYDPSYRQCDREPLREVIERLCKDLDLNPDWSRWTGDDWDADYRPRRTPGSIFSQPSRTPLLDQTERRQEEDLWQAALERYERLDAPG
ncbi:MAG: hypothetical protein ABSD80_07610 [Caulobacteraceae bacterium]|jgi:hypothetical protein